MQCTMLAAATDRIGLRLHDGEQYRASRNAKSVCLPRGLAILSVPKAEELRWVVGPPLVHGKAGFGSSFR